MYEPIPKKQPKRKKARDRREGMSKVHLEWMSRQRCLICGVPDVQVHHLLSVGGRGMGLKAVDKHTIPLCVMHHTMLHDNGSKNEEEFMRGYFIPDLKAVAEEFWDERLKEEGETYD